jgi:hypothetical protein
MVRAFLAMMIYDNTDTILEPHRSLYIYHLLPQFLQLDCHGPLKHTAGELLGICRCRETLFSGGTNPNLSPTSANTVAQLY